MKAKQKLIPPALVEVSVRKNWVILDNCPICDSQNWKPVLAGRSDCHLSFCPDCTAVFLNPRPSKSGTLDSGYMQNHARMKYLPRMIEQGFITEEHQPDVPKLYGRYQKMVDLTASLSPSEPVIDVGCAIGLSMMALRHKGIESIGFDVDDGFIEVAKDVFGLDVRKEDVFFAGRERRYPIATSNAVLEHIDDPVSFLVAIRENILQPDGALVITVPNVLSTKFLEDGPTWETISGGHVWYPSEKTMTLVAERAGFTVETIYQPPTAAAYRDHRDFFLRALLEFKGNLSGGIGMILRSGTKPVKGAVANQDRAANLERQLHAVLNSTSWKVTAPLRSLATKLRGRKGLTNSTR